MNGSNERLSPLKQALLALQQMQARLELLERKQSEPIAVIGVGCRFPGGADGPEGFWRMMQAGVDAVGEIPRDRWDVDLFYDPDAGVPGMIATRYGSFLRHVDQFDATFFDIAPREASEMDPQQRLLLEVTWEALDAAGLALDRVAGSRTGVFVGLFQDDYRTMQFSSPTALDGYSGPGISRNILAGRISYLLDLHGPCFAIDTACSSSLVAVHLAVQSLRNRECSMALAGGINLILDPTFFICASQMRMLSPDGRCKAFDAGGDGMGRGEGCGMVVLKRLADAQADNDNIVAVIRGTAVNQDGHTNGITAPNGIAQRAVIRQALSDSGMDPSSVTFVEAHGTGTPLGDPVEMEALTEIYGQPDGSGDICTVGAVKTNIAHAEGAAGIAGLIKAALCIKHGWIPPNLHLKKLNRHIVLDRSRLMLPEVGRPWQPKTGHKVAAVSSFGWSGTNAHVILEQAPAAGEIQQTAHSGDDAKAWILPLSTKAPQALREAALRMKDWLSGDEATGYSLADIGYTRAVRRTHYSHRLVAVGATLGAWIDCLNAVLAGEPRPGLVQGQAGGESIHRMVFVFDGHGSQWVGMAQALMDTEPVVRESLEQCDALMQQEDGFHLLQELQSSGDASRLEEVDVVQRAIFALQIALAAQWRSWGVEPTAVVGHSLGEIAAAHTSGILSLQDAVRVICTRSRVVRDLAGGSGSLLAVEMAPEQAEALVAPFHDQLVVGVINGPTSVALSGSEDALARVQEQLVAKGTLHKRVRIRFAAHSPAMKPPSDAMRKELYGLRPKPGTVPFYSTVTGRIEPGTNLDAAYWARNLAEPVQFAPVIQHLRKSRHTCFLEIGGHPVLLSSIKDNLNCIGARGVTVGSLARNRGDRARLLESLGQLYCAGYAVDWRRLYPSEDCRLAPLPTYPWQRQRYWLAERPVTPRTSPREEPSSHPILKLGVHVLSSIETDTRFWDLDLGTKHIPYLSEHVIAHMVILPAAVYLEMAASAALEATGHDTAVLEDVAIAEALVLADDSASRVQLALAGDPAAGAAFKICSRRDVKGRHGAWTVHCSGRMHTSLHNEERTYGSESLTSIQARCTHTVSGSEHYRRAEAHHMHYGPAFRCIEAGWYHDGEALCRIRWPKVVEDGAGGYILHPSILDASFQAVLIAMDSKPGLVSAGDTWLPVGMHLFRMAARVAPGDCLWVHTRIIEAEASDSLTADVTVLRDGDQVVLEVRGLLLRQARLSFKAHAEDWIYTIAWQPQPETPTTNDASGNWLLFHDQGGVAEALRNNLEERGAQCVSVRAGPEFSSVSPELFTVNPASAQDAQRLLTALSGDRYRLLRGVVHLMNLDSNLATDGSLEQLNRDIELGCMSTLHLVQALAVRTDDRPPRLWLVTAGAQAVEADGVAPAVAQAALWGLARTIGSEHPSLQCTLVDLAKAGDAPDVLLRELLNESSESEVAWRHGNRFSPRLVQKASTSLDLPPLRFAADATYLLTGGTGGIGQVVARWMVDRGARHLALMSRSGLSENNDPALGIPAEMGVELRIVCGDVANPQHVQRVLSEIDTTMPPLRGIIHAAGVLEDATLLHMDGARFRVPLAPKVAGAWNLHLGARNRSLDHFVLFSSLAGVLGTQGQGNYAAANAFLDSLAWHRRARGLPAQSIDWGSWSEVGMAAAQENRGVRLAARGIAPLSPAEGVEALERVLQDKEPQVVVAKFDSLQWQASTGARRASLLAGLVDRTMRRAPLETVSQEPFRSRLLVADAGSRFLLLAAHVKAHLAAVLRIEASQIRDDVPFRTMGMESLASLELRNGLEASLDLTIPAATIWDYPTISDLVVHLAQKMNVPLDDDKVPEDDNSSGSDPESALRHLSDEDLIARLDQTLAEIDI